MKIFIILISTFLTWTAFDTNLFRKRGNSLNSSEPEISLEVGLRQKKKIRQHRLAVIPQKYRKIKRPLRSKCNYFSTKSRDRRDSDQQMIRKKING